MNLSAFNETNLFDATTDLFSQLGIKLNSNTSAPIPINSILKEYLKDSRIFKSIKNTYFLGVVNDDSLSNDLFSEQYSYSEAEKTISERYKGIMIFALESDITQPTRTELAELVRAFNRVSKSVPIVLVVKYQDKIAFIICERNAYLQTWRTGEKIGKVVLLKDINPEKPNTAHLKILKELSIAQHQEINSFELLYKYWRSVFSIQTLNDNFYKDLQDWFYWATKEIKLPFCHSYTTNEDNIKNFLVRLLARTMFCWFVKEKGLIQRELLELTDWQNNKYKLTNDVNANDFLQNNSYYRGILQNIFFRALNQKDKSSSKDFEATRYLHPDFNYDWLINIPYLNGGIFDELLEDNARDSNEDTVIKVPNYLFYGIEKQEKVTSGKGARQTTQTQSVFHKGLNGIFKEYKFTLEENTPFEEDIALDPELLGLVFENLLAELDPNLEESTIKSIRKLTGSYYTPRKVIQEMVNESLFLYLLKFVQNNNPELKSVKKELSDLVYRGIAPENASLCKAVVVALDKFKVLDPACGSGAFPMGVLHRMVDLLKLVDEHNELWVDLKLQSIPTENRADFKNVLTKHLDDYSRKLGIIRDSIYGIDIQPLAVQITKLRFFISLLIDQKTDKGITPMPNIETKIICADSLKNIQPDLFSAEAIPHLQEARIRYYQPDLTHNERDAIAEDIADILDNAFPSFARQITGKNISGQNKVLLKEWFTHATVAAPFFNMEFFYPELEDTGGFDCIIGNPPYGGTKISDDVRDNLGLDSKDPYGAFIARFLNQWNKTTPLKHGGVLAFIVSDTFMTIKSHLKLRKHLMQNYIHKMLRVHPDTFRATVNTVIMIGERNIKAETDENHICQMADMTNISIHENYERFVEVLNQTKGIDFDQTVINQNISNKEYAIYYYKQNLIATNSNLSFFVSCPKLFVLMKDNGRDLKTEIINISRKQTQVRKISINNKEIKLLRLGDIAEVKQGIKTGDNQSYLFQNPEARGTYKSINNFKSYLLTTDDLDLIRSNEKLRLDVIENGFCKESKNINRFFNGRFIVPLDKGGESDADDGFMPNYFIPTEYYIDWSEWAVNRMENLTIGERDNSDNDSICSRLQNMAFNFKKGITFSPTGIYSPTFRINSAGIFESKGSTLFFLNDDDEKLLSVLAFLNSKLAKYAFKTCISHTVETGEHAIESIFYQDLSNSLSPFTHRIIERQKQNLRYDFASHEQIEIDRLVYEAYGLNTEDIEEVENWYARRYPKLSKAQKQNLRNLGKSDDYLELYGLR